LDAVWPILILDALVLKIRDQGSVRNKSAYLVP
jgi:transposase-like protein